jgi:endonuclease/exonuclease/phosphatase family metal-dependent hydrolase
MTPIIIPGRLKPHLSDIATDRSFSTVSLNMAKEADAQRVLRTISGVPRLRDADVYLFQEVRHAAGQASVAEEAAKALGYSVVFQPAAGFTDQGLAIVSRYPLKDVQVSRLKPCDLRFRSRNRFSIAATVQTPWQDVRVWNVHLDTRINAGERLDQLHPVIDDAANYNGPRLIGGDFNTNEMYWLGSVFPMPFGPAHGSIIRGRMHDHGFETPFQGKVNTFPMFRGHLDWIFLSNLKAVDSSVEPVPFSDHRAVWVRAQLN